MLMFCDCRDDFWRQSKVNDELYQAVQDQLDITGTLCFIRADLQTVNDDCRLTKTPKPHDAAFAKVVETHQSREQDRDLIAPQRSTHHSICSILSTMSL